MRKLILPLLTLFLLCVGIQHLKAQKSVDLFCEDFNTLPWKMATRGTPSKTAPIFHADSNVFKDLTGYSASDTIGAKAKTYLTTPNIHGIQKWASIGVQFSQIAYIGQFNNVYLEISVNGGTTWQLCKHNTYTGQSFMKANGAFSKISRSVDWRFFPINDDSYVWTNSNAKWALETFNLNSFTDTTSSDSIRLRIVVENAGAAPQGRVGKHRYFIDNFCVRGSNCELIPPQLSLDFPPVNYPTRYEDRIYLQGPYYFNAQATDNSNIDTVFIDYIVSRDTTPNDGIHNYVEIKHDTAGMRSVGFAYFNGSIPKADVQVMDSVRWRVIAIDASCGSNRTQDPAQGFTQFLIKPNLPISCTSQPVYEFPYVQDFNGPDWIPNSSGNLRDGWKNVEGDFHNWWVNMGPTPTKNTGPSDDYPGGGNYLYVEATGYPDSLAFLVSPCFDLTEMKNSSFKFYLNQNTVGEDTIRVDIFDVTPLPGYPNGRYLENVVPALSGNKGDKWYSVEFSGYKYRNSVAQVRFRAKPGKLSDLSDMAMDSFSVYPAALTDLLAERIVVGPYNPENENMDVIVNIQNKGISDATSLLLNYDIIMDGTNIVKTSERDIQWTGLIKAGEYEEVTIPNAPYKVPLGAYTIKAWLEYKGDEVVGNDTTQQRTRGLAYKSGYYMETFDDFDRDTLFTALAKATDTVGNFWELGTPNYGRTNSAFSSREFNSPYTQDNAWDILLDRAYTGDGNTVQLITPFIDFSTSANPFISFFNNRDIDTTKAGVYIQYSLDKGFTWDSVRSTGDPGKIKWYNSYLAAPGFGGQPVFAGRTREMSGNWGNFVESELRLPANIFAFEPYVLFRFNFFAEDYTNNSSDYNSNAGMTIDNFLVYDEKATDIMTQYIMQPGNQCYMTSSQRFKVVFKNRGSKIINNFKVDFIVTHIPTNTTVKKSETFSKTINPRDTGIVKSTVNFDMRALGDYKVSVITQMPGDEETKNDTLVKYVENIDGCSMIFQAVTGGYKRPARVDSSFWRFEYTSDNGRKYIITDDYRPFNPYDTNRIPICVRKNSNVQFLLGDQDTTIISYSLYAYDGQHDTIIVNQAIGGPDSPAQYFKWVCPPERSTTTTDIYIDNNAKRVPFAKDYFFEMRLRNNGLDSVVDLEIGMSVDGQVLGKKNIVFAPPLEYNQYSRRYSFSTKFMSPGKHLVKAWTHNPNNQMDEIPWDDTLSREFAVIDTTIDGKGPNGDRTRLDSNMKRISLDSGEYCTDFESGETVDWVAMKFPGFGQPGNFEVATPATTHLSGARSGDNAWVTNAKGNYKNFDSSAVLSPFFQMTKDSCYQLEMYHNYYFDGKFNDGAQVRLSTDTGNTWKTLNNVEGGVGDTALQRNWYNTQNIIAILDNDINAGWTGQSDGWVRSTTFIPSYADQFGLFLFRFASDGNGTSEGWAIDDICFRPIPSANCFSVGLDEEKMDLSKLYLGQNVPNPAQQSVEIPYYLPNAGNVIFEVNNVMGQEVKEMNVSQTKGNQLLKLDISDLSAGVYYYSITFNNQKISKKMLITK